MFILRPLNQLVISELCRYGNPEVSAGVFGIDKKVASVLMMASESTRKRLCDNLLSLSFSLRNEGVFWESIIGGEKRSVPDDVVIDPVYLANVSTFNNKVYQGIIDLIKTEHKYAAYHFGLSVAQVRYIAKKPLNQILESIPDTNQPVAQISWDARTWKVLVADNQSMPSLNPLIEYTRLLSMMRVSDTNHSLIALGG